MGNIVKTFDPEVYGLYSHEGVKVFRDAYDELAALERHGVDNWEGYDEAMECADSPKEPCDICD